MSAPAIQNRSGGCLKCGEPGHWARDCQAPKEKWLAYKQKNNDGASQQLQTDDDPDNNNNQENNDIAAQPLLGAAAAARQNRQKPKLTYDMLKASNGLPEVYHNFPDMFRAQFRGKGHEASDLRRLLEMYKRWQDRIFPHGSFDSFISSVEKMSSERIVQSEMQAMRTDMLEGVKKELVVGVQEEEVMAVEEEQQQQQEEVFVAIDSDEEYLQLAAAPMEPPADDDEIDDDALLEMLAAEQQPAADVDEEADDEELLRLAMEQD